MRLPENVSVEHRVILSPSDEDGRRISTLASSTLCGLRSFGEPRRFASGLQLPGWLLQDCQRVSREKSGLVHLLKQSSQISKMESKRRIPSSNLCSRVIRLTIRCPSEGKS